MASNTRLNALLRVYRVDDRAAQRALIQRAIAELDALYPHLAGGSHPYHYAIAEALAQADTNGGRIPVDTPYLGATCEALVTRDPAVTLPPQPEPEPWPALGEFSEPTPEPMPVPVPVPQQATRTPPRTPPPDVAPDDWQWDSGRGGDMVTAAFIARHTFAQGG